MSRIDELSDEFREHYENLEDRKHVDVEMLLNCETEETIKNEIDKHLQEVGFDYLDRQNLVPEILEALKGKE